MKYLNLALLLLVPSLARAQDHDAIAKYITDEVVAVAYLDLSQIDTLGALEWVEELGFGPPPQERGQAIKFMMGVQQWLDTYGDLGVRNVYALFRASDISYGGPTWVVPVAEPENTRAVMGMILSGRPDDFEIERDLRPSFIPEHCDTVAGAVLGANSPEQLEMLKAASTTTERDLSDAWQILGNGHCGLVIFGNKDSRRVVREMFPKLPAPFEAIDGELIADGLLWGGLVANLPPEPQLQLVVQTDSEDTAQVLQASVTVGKQLLNNLLLAQPDLSHDEREALVGHISSQIEDRIFVIRLDELLEDVQLISNVVKPSIQKAKQAATKMERINKFKQIALAMLNYESANGHYPPRGTYSDDGKPLLSWRVHILPYLEQGELYAKFKLDEPWDSEHNKQLIPLMPEIYADPDPKLANRNKGGLTTYLVPTGVGTVFSGTDGTLLKDITDGTSNTVLLIERPQSNGLRWTQPVDWVVDFGVWTEQSRFTDRDWFTAAFCDGSVRTIPVSTDAETLRRLIQIADGEVVELP